MTTERVPRCRSCGNTQREGHEPDCAIVLADFHDVGIPSSAGRVRHLQEASSTPTFTTDSRKGCALQLPPRIMEPNASTMTREEYLYWRDGD